MFQNLTLNSVVWILLGFGLLGYSAYMVWIYRFAVTSFYLFPTFAGCLLLGLVAILSGYTNGFTDHSPIGRKLKKLGIFLAVAGLPLLAYGIYRSL